MTQRPRKKGPTEGELAAEQRVMASKLATVEAVKSNEIALVQHFEAVQTLEKPFLRAMVEMGYHLTEAKAICKEKGEPWLPRLDRELGWNERQAQRYMEAYRDFLQLSCKSDTMSDRLLDLPISVASLRLLAAPSTPPEIVAEVIERTEAGEHYTLAQVQEKIDAARNAGREEAQAQAKALLDHTQGQFDQAQTELNDLRAKAFEDKAEREDVERSKIDEAVTKATVPLHKQIEKLERDKERAERPAEPKQPPRRSLPKYDLMIRNTFDRGLDSLFSAVENHALTVERLLEMDPSEDWPHRATVVSEWLKRYVEASGDKSKPKRSSRRRKASRATEPELTDMPDGEPTPEDEPTPKLD
jgi:hypothetical protein